LLFEDEPCARLIRIALFGVSQLWWGVPFTTRICLLVCVAAVAVAHPAFAQVDRPASVTVKIALDPSVGGNVTTAGTAVITVVLGGVGCALAMRKPQSH
jgi:hypothetical protein